MDVFGSSGARGIANAAITPEFVVRVARAAGSEWEVDRAAVGKDTRLTGDMLVAGAAAGLASAGIDVDRLGVIPTPGAQAYCDRSGIPGIVVTASHNPPEYNGLKLIGPDGVELSRAALDRIEGLLSDDGGAGRSASWNAVGSIQSVDGSCETYIEHLLAAVDRQPIASGDLTVALDPGHGAGCLTSPRFLRELGCKVVTVHAQPDGHFPGRDPEPIPENLGDLGDLVRAADADVGIAHDGDADRAIFFDEHGEYVEGDATLAALAAAELAPGDSVVSAVNVSQRLVDVCEDVGADLELTPIGSTNIITEVSELVTDGTTVPIAGEGNGGVLFPEYRLARDGAYTAAKFLTLLTDQSVSEVVAPYSGYHNVRRKVNYDDPDHRSAMLEAARERARMADAELDTTDGYRLDYGDAWVLVRPSGTEPVVRIYAEARTADRAVELADAMERALRDGVPEP